MSESGGNESLMPVVIGVAVVALAAVGIGIGIRSHNETALKKWTGEQSVLSVSLVPLNPAKSGGALTLPAALQAFNSAPIYARTSGYVRSWYVDIGDIVRQGQLLAVLDAPEVDQQLAAAEANLQTARANQELAATTAQRWRTMLAKDAVSKQETDEKVSDLAAKTAVTNANAADVRRLRYQQGFTRLVAPFSGVVTTRSANIGALINAGNVNTPLFTVSDVTRIRAYVKVPQAYSAQIHPGMKVALALPEYPGRSFEAELTRTADAVDPTSGTVLVELQANNSNRALKPGAYAQASFPLTAISNSFILPATAMIFNDGGMQVAVLGSDNRVHIRKVTIGKDMGNTVEISAGLSPGDRVIDSPPDSLQEGDVVNVSGQAHGNAAK